MKKEEMKTLGVVVAVIGAFGLGMLVSKSPNPATDAAIATSSNMITDTGTTEIQTELSVISADDGTTLNIGGKDAVEGLDTEIQSQLNTLQGYIDAIYSDNGLLFVHSGEELAAEQSGATTEEMVIIEAYNKDKQTYIELVGGVPEFFYRRGKSVLFSDVASRRNDLTTVDVLQGVIDIALTHTEGVEVSKKVIEVHENDDYINVDLEADSETTYITDDTDEESDTSTDIDRGDYLYTETITTIRISRDKIKDYYQEEFGDAYMGCFNFTNLWDLSKNDTISDDYVYFNFVTTNIDNQMGAGEYVVSDGTPYISWFFNNHFKLTDWTMDAEAWAAQHTVQELIDLANDVQSVITTASEKLESEINSVVEVYESEDALTEETETEVYETAEDGTALSSKNVQDPLGLSDAGEDDVILETSEETAE